MFVRRARREREDAAIVRVADERRARIWLQVGAHVVEHQAQLRPVTFLDLDAVRATEQKRVEEQLCNEAVIAG